MLAKRRLGPEGLEVSEYGLSCMGMSHAYSIPNPRRKEAVTQARQPEPDNRCLKQKGLTVNEQIAGPSVNPSAGSFIQDLMPLLTNYDSMKMSINIDQFSDVEKLATLTQLYLELRLPLHDALRAAEADL
jgi:hypothetical protein